VPGYRTKTRSRPGAIRDFTSRNASKTKRRARFLRTAFPYLRTGMKRTRTVAVPFGTECRRMPLTDTRVPLSNVLSMSFRSRRRSRFRKVQRSANPASFSTESVLLSFIRNRQLGSALGPAAFQDEPTAKGLHSSPKAEFPDSASTARLVRAFHGKMLLAISRLSRGFFFPRRDAFGFIGQIERLYDYLAALVNVSVLSAFQRVS